MPLPMNGGISLKCSIMLMGPLELLIWWYTEVVMGSTKESSFIGQPMYWEDRRKDRPKGWNDDTDIIWKIQKEKEDDCKLQYGWTSIPNYKYVAWIWISHLCH